MRRLALALLLGCSVAIAAPAVTDVTWSGALGNGTQITITGSGFGSAPEHILVWHDFEGTNGAAVGNSDPSVGSWGGMCALESQPPTDQVDCDVPRYSTAESLGGSSSYEYVRDATGAHNAPYVDIPNLSEVEAYLSCWWYIQAGTDIRTTSLSHKVTWILGPSPDQAIDNDRTWTFQGNQCASGPGYCEPRNAGNSDGTNAYWGAGFNATGTWFLYQQYYYAGTSGASWADGHIWGGGIDNGGTWDNNMFNSSGAFFDGDAADPDGGFDGWSIWAVPCGHVNGSAANAKCYVDDCYAQAGDNARSAVRLFNNGNKQNSTKVTHCTLGAGGDSWSATSITCTVREGPFSGTDPVHLSVYDSTGAFSSNTNIGSWGDTSGGGDPATDSLAGGLVDGGSVN